MKLDNMFKKTKASANEYSDSVREQPEVPQGLLKKCNKCGKAIIAEEAKKGLYICPKCGGYFRMPACERLHSIADAGSFEEWDSVMEEKNPLDFPGYPEKLAQLKEKTGLNEAVITGKIKIHGIDAAVGVMDGRFMMASMGHAVGEKITRMIECATLRKLPVILFTCSGGARMQEGIVSLMQMAKTSAALKRHSEEGLLYVSVLTDPTTGGVTASFAMLGDIILAEPKALIGFAGQRVIEQTIRQKLPKGFQRSEFLLEHGLIDQIVERKDMRDVLGRLLRFHCPGDEETETGLTEDIINAVHEKASDFEEAYEHMCGKTEAIGEAYSAWESVLLSRKADRPVGSDYLELLFDNFSECHGDRFYGDDAAIVGGIADFHGQAVTVIAQVKGSDTKENMKRNFGMPSPEGYRKALRLMRQAEKFRRPIICLVDTPGAFCGIEAEERGQGEAIARNLYEMSSLTVPILSIVIGEGGSGGALAMAVADEVWMLENSIYSILSPEGFASILWKDGKKARDAAQVMKLTARELKKLGIIEKILPEPENFTRDCMTPVVRQMDYHIEKFLRKYQAMTEAELVEHRYRRFREM